MGYVQIMQNILHVELKRGYYDKCSCNMTDISPCSPKNGCLNVLSHIECSPDVCPAQERCQNQKFRQGPQFGLQIRKTKTKGWGLYAMEKIPAEEFIIEYMGEVIDDEECARRFRAAKDDNFYFIALGQKMFIDSKKYGNDSRFSNHSCEPNAAAMKWTAYIEGQEHIRIGLFALREIHMVGCI